MNDNKNTSKTLSAYKDNFLQKIISASKLLKKLHQEWRLETLSALYTEISQFYDLAEIAGDYELRNIAGELEIVLESLAGKSSLSEVEMCRIELFLQQLSSLLNLHVNTLIDNELEDQDEKIVCVFDPDLDWCKYFSIQLCGFGYKVKIFTETTLISQMIDQTQFSALIINVELITPELKQALEKMQLNGLLKNKAVVFISTTGEPMLRLDTIRLGGTGFFVKPFLTEEVVAHLDAKYDENFYQPRVLIIDDDSNEANLYAQVLMDAGIESHIETEFLKINSALSEFLPDLILMDIGMPGCDGLELTALIRQQNRYESIPIIYLSGETNKARQLHALSMGADDFFSKETDSKYLVPTMMHCLNRYKVFKSAMVKDELTRVFNHRALMHELDIHLRLASRLNAPLSVILMDMDGLDTINQKFGHEAGDQVLRSLAIMMRRRLRLSDVVGRYSNGRFMVILPNTAIEPAIKVVSELRETFKKLEHAWNDVKIECSFSAGVSGYPHFRTIPELIQSAEQALSFAKTHGKNRTEVM